MVNDKVLERVWKGLKVYLCPMKIITIVGARPQFIKAAAINRSFRLNHTGQVQELLLHTGQHYDANMSEVFFTELELDQPAFRLQVGSGNHGQQTGEMLSGIENILLTEKPDAVIVYGDTNSTLAGAVAAAKLHIPVIHIEAGIRSFNKAMPEEVNRVLTDHVSSLLFSPTDSGIANLAMEGITTTGEGTANNPKAYRCGDIMLDNSLYFAAKQQGADLLSKVGVAGKPFILATVHRNSNTDVPERLASIMRGIMSAASGKQWEVVLPLHPRTLKMLQQQENARLWGEMQKASYLHITEPLGYMDMVVLESQCELIMTDSGGVQKEAYFFHKPCIVLRPETEWVELLAAGACMLADADSDRITSAFNELSQAKKNDWPSLYGDGQAADFITATIVQHLSR